MTKLSIVYIVNNDICIAATPKNPSLLFHGNNFYANAPPLYVA